jgi:Glycosyl transferases group 1
MNASDSSLAALKRCTAVWSRDVDPSRLAGRPQMIQAIRKKISESTQANHRRLNNVLERRSLRAITGMVVTAFRSLLRCCPPSLQCLLFCDRPNHGQIIEELRGNRPDILYCDGVRTFYFLERLGKLRSEMKIVVDFDDLMSRRMQSLAAADTSLSLGYLHRVMPSWLRRAVALGFISKAVARYEQGALIRVENQIGTWADAVVLISQVEGNALQARYRALGCKAKVHVIPPQMEIVAPPQSYTAFSRFIFIGTDALPQNKLTIQLISNLWRLIHPSVEIHIYGHMVSEWPHVPGVIFEGYAAALQQVYTEGSVLFSPGVLPGGLKTKVTEAFAHGCAVVGNEITLEGLHLVDYPLSLTTNEEMAEIVKTPTLYLCRMYEAACSGQKYVRSFVSRKQFEKNWGEVLE